MTEPAGQRVDSTGRAPSWRRPSGDRCPRCGTLLEITRLRRGALCHACQVCGGRGLTLAVLRPIVHVEEFRRLWAAARGGAPLSTRCPVCRRRMVEAVVADGVELDVCRGCQFVWLDPGELQRLPPPPAVERSLPPGLEEQFIEMEKDLEARLARVREHTHGLRSTDRIPAPADWWKWVPALLGLPVEYDRRAPRRRPWVTWGLVAAMAAVFVATWPDPMAAIVRWGLDPGEVWRSGGLTLLTSVLLHADAWHLLGNAWFLLVFADDVEEELGPARHALLLLAAALCGALVHVAYDPRPDVPLVGASAAVSGVVVHYALRFPRSRLGFLIYFRWGTAPAWLAVLTWFLFQILGVIGQTSGLSAVSALAHLGGAGVGLAAFLGGRLAARRRADPPPRPSGAPAGSAPEPRTTDHGGYSPPPPSAEG